MLQRILNEAPLFLLVAARCMALLFTLPLFSMKVTPKKVKIALAAYMAFFLMKDANYTQYASILSIYGEYSIYFVLLLIGEALIGLILGFYVSIIFSAFSTAGQFFAFQMGFSAASAYDALSQVENPLMGQYLNFLAMIIFLDSFWFQKLFLGGLKESIVSVNIFTLIENKDSLESLSRFLLKGLSSLFLDAFIIALPVMGVLLFISVCTGLLSKAAPQMNLLSEGFPIMILVSFGILSMALPKLCNLFDNSFSEGIASLLNFIESFSITKGGQSG